MEDSMAKNVSKKTPLYQHMTSDEFVNRDDIVLPTNWSRGAPGYFGRQGSWSDVAQMIQSPRMRGVNWVPDSNVAFLPAARPVWDALRVAALGNPEGSTLITGTVEYEMKEWLAEPYRQPDLAAMINEAIETNSWIRTLRDDPNHPLRAAVVNYTHLLGFRRALAIPFENGMTIVETNSADKSATMNKISSMFGARAIAAAKKGRDEFERNGKVSYNDEMHCMMTIVNALEQGKQSAILTADIDLVETFFKAQRMVDTHYRSWLAAPMVQNGYFGEMVKQIEFSYFHGPLTLYRRRTHHLHEVLPSIADIVPVSMLYVAPDQQLHLLTFPFEKPMLDMMAMRAKTDGSCTELFGNANIHVELGPIKNELDALYLGIGSDRKMTYTDDGKVAKLSSLDLHLSAACFETFFQ